MLVSMTDEVRKLDNVSRDRQLPSRIRLMMVLNDKINRTIRPCEEPLQLSNWLLEERKVVQVYGKDDRHRLVPSDVTSRVMSPHLK